MNENEFENVDSTNNTDETVNNEEIEFNLDDEVVEDVEALKKQIATLQAQKDHWRNKANKPAETAKEVKTESNSTLSTKDLYALMENKVSEEDIDEVTEYAQLKKVSIAEVLKSSAVKALLKEKSEMRNVALATNTGIARRSSSKISDEDMVANANKGNLPEDAVALAQARFQMKFKK